MCEGGFSFPPPRPPFRERWPWQFQQEPGRTKNSPSQGRRATSFRDRPGYDPPPIQKKKKKKRAPWPQGSGHLWAGPLSFTGVHCGFMPATFLLAMLIGAWILTLTFHGESKNQHLHSHNADSPTSWGAGVRTATYEFGEGDTIQPITPSIKWNSTFFLQYLCIHFSYILSPYVSKVPFLEYFLSLNEYHTVSVL